MTEISLFIHYPNPSMGVDDVMIASKGKLGGFLGNI